MNKTRFTLLASFLLCALAVAARAQQPPAELISASGVCGGVVVHVGCGDGTQTLGFRTGDAFVVEGLTADAVQITAARRRAAEAGFGGTVTFRQYNGKDLPYADDFVNLLVCEEPVTVSDAEIRRVLVPGGVALVKTGDGCRRITKEWPADLDEWTHYLHGPDNNAVSSDKRIKPPLRHLQWVGGPRWSRHHDMMSSVSASVSAAGRLFLIVDEGPTFSIFLPPAWKLVARDAFNGTVLWKRDISEWVNTFWPLKSGPAQVPRRLVALGDAVYATLGIHAPVTKLDAATGETLHTYAGTENTDEIIVAGDVLYLVLNEKVPVMFPRTWSIHPKRILAVREDDGHVLWSRELPWVAPCSLTVAPAHILAYNGQAVVALNRDTGELAWRSEPLPAMKPMEVFLGPTLVATGNEALFAGGEGYFAHGGSFGKMTCLDLATGKTRWQVTHPPSGYKSAQDIFVIDGQAWCGNTTCKPTEGGTNPNSERYKSYEKYLSTGEMFAYSLTDGRQTRALKPTEDCYWFHHRCHRAKATEDYFLLSRTGIEFVDTKTGAWTLHHWTRGACLYGVMPANGLVYAPPHPCACYPETKLNGLNALSGPRPERAPNASPLPRLVKGVAFGTVPADAPDSVGSDWPTFRGNAERSASVQTAVADSAVEAWRVAIPGAKRLTQPVVAAGKLFVSSIDTHTIHALDAGSGKVLWSHATGGRVDTPPTFYRGALLFGCADGHVRCLRAEDGALAWQFRAAADEKRIMAWEQLESAWPVHGSILVQNDAAWFVAGRSLFLDGGIDLFKLNPRTGEVLLKTHMDNRIPDGRDIHDLVKTLDIPAGLPDILSSDGKHLFMRSQAFTLDGKRKQIRVLPVNVQTGETAHIFARHGFTDDSWWHRDYWIYGTQPQGGPGYSAVGNQAPSGRLMAHDHKTLYVFGRRQKYFRWTTPMEWRVFAVDLPPQPAKPPQGKIKQSRKPPARYATLWSNEQIPLLARGLVRTANRLVLAGFRDTLDEEQAFKSLSSPEMVEKARRQGDAVAGLSGGLLCVIDPATGEPVSQADLHSPPVFDGLIAADERLFISHMDGTVSCRK